MVQNQSLVSGIEVDGSDVPEAEWSDMDEMVDVENGLSDEIDYSSRWEDEERLTEGPSVSATRAI